MSPLREAPSCGRVPPGDSNATGSRQGHGRLALNWQEAEELRLRQLAETRKQRLLQVREQANQQSQQKLRSYQQQRQALSKVKLAELKNDWEISKERALVGLRQIRDSSLQQVGTSHICAAQALSQNSGRRQQKMAETAGHNRAAMERHSAAMAAEAAERMAAAEARKEMLARQDKVRKMELQRSFAAVAESSRRVRELAAKQEETQQREKELMAQGLPSGIDFKYTRLHELGMPEVVERHYGAGCDGHGKGMLAAVAYETERAWNVEQQRRAARVASVEREDKRAALARLRIQMEDNKKAMEGELEKMRLDKLRKTAEDLAKGVPQSNLTCDFDHRSRQAAAEKYFEKHLLGKLAAQEESTKGSIPPETLEREPSGWPTDDGWVPSGATSLNGSESLLGQSRPPKTGASHPSLPADEPKAQGGKGAGSGYPGYDAPTQVIVPNKSAFEDEARASLETTIIEPPGDQLDPAVRVRQYLEHAAAMQEVRLSESDALTAGATWAVPKSWDGERAGPVRAQTTLASTQHPEAGPVEDALGPTVNPGSQTGLGPKPQVARPGKGRGGRVNGLHSAQRGPAVIRFQDSAPTSSRLHQKPRRTAAAAQAKAVQRRAPAIPDTGPSTRTASNVAARNYRDSRSLSVQGVPGKRFVPRRIEASTGAVLVATLAKSESTLVSEPPGSWTTAGDIDGNSLAELQALQRELGIPVSDTLPSYGESMVSSDISGLSAFLDTHRRGVQVAADRAIQAVASVKRGPVHDRDTSRGPDLEQDDQVPEPRPLLLTAAVSRADRVAPTPSRPVRQSGPEATADVDAANPQAEPQLPRASSPKYGSPPAKVTRRSGGWSHPSSPARDMMGQSAAEATRLRQQLLSELSDAASAGRTSSRATVGGSAPNSPVVGSSSWEAEHLKRRPVSAAGYSRPSLPGERPPIEESYRSPDRVSSIPDSDPSTGDLGSAALTGLSVLVEKARIEALRASATAKISQPLLPQEAIDQLHSVPSSASSDHTSLSRAVPSEAAVLRDDAQISPASSTISSLSDLIPDVRWHISQRIPADVEISPTSSDEDELPDESEDSWVYKDSRGRTNFQSLMPAGVNDQAQSSIQAKRTDHAAEVGLEPDTSLDSSGLTSLSSLAERSLPRFNFAAPASVPWEAQSHTGHRVSQTPEERETHGLSSPASSGFTGLSALAPDQPPTDSTADIPGDHIAPVPGALAGESGLDVLKQEDMSGDPNESEGSPHEEVAWRGEATGPEEERGMTLTPETLTKLAAYISEQAYRSGLYPGAVAGAASTRGDVPQQGDETAHSCSAPSSLAQVFLGGPEELPRNSATEWLAGQGGEVGKITTGGMTYPGQLHIAHEGRGSEETEESAMGPAEQMATLVAAEHARQLQGLWGQERKTKDSFQTGCSSPLDEAYEEPGPLGLDPLPSNQPTEPDASEMLHEMENLSGGMELRRLGPTAEADNRFSRQLLDVDSSSGISVYSHLLERPTPAPSAAPSISISVASSSLRRAAAASVMGDMRAVETAAAAKQRTTAALAPSSYAGSDHGSERPSHSRANSEPQVGLNATAAEGSRPRSADGEVYSPSGSAALSSSFSFARKGSEQQQHEADGQAGKRNRNDPPVDMDGPPMRLPVDGLMEATGPSSPRSMTSSAMSSRLSRDWPSPSGSIPSGERTKPDNSYPGLGVSDEVARRYARKVAELEARSSQASVAHPARLSILSSQGSGHSLIQGAAQTSPAHRTFLAARISSGQHSKPSSAPSGANQHQRERQLDASKGPGSAKPGQPVSGGSWK